MRRAVPLTVSEQGPVGAAGLPAVLVSATGERGAAGREPLDGDRMQELGRAVLRSVDALDGAGRERRARVPRTRRPGSSRCATCCPTGPCGS